MHSRKCSVMSRRWLEMGVDEACIKRSCWRSLGSKLILGSWEWPEGFYALPKEKDHTVSSSSTVQSA